ncbi:MAG: preprotein translocase subunit SecA [Dehalococcoidales bacterium]|nr:preprotein translocase subunit SecA [Dehalococcoidales bacterium]
MFKWLENLFDSNEKVIKRLQPVIDEINSLEPEYEKLSDEQLRAKTDEFKSRLQDGEDLDDLLPEAFATVREAAKRKLGERAFDVQLIGGIVLHQGKIAEMKTGEGKTLTATFPLYLNSLTGKGAHLVTVNDYLARIGPYWMGPVYQALGVSVASIYPQQDPSEHTPARIYDPQYDTEKERDPWRHYRPISRLEAYEADITYGTSSDFGFDYLRDNMVQDISQCVQRPPHYAIVDEVDNLLIDEARTPLIISGPAEEAGQLYAAVNSVVSGMKFKVFPNEPNSPSDYEEESQYEEDFDYFAYEKNHTIKETARGQERLAKAFKMPVEDIFGGFGGDQHSNLTLEETKLRNDILSIFRKSMAAHAWYQRERDYVVKDGEVIIVDEFTGRMMYGRRYSEGLHQAIEAKERVKVQRESMTYATITIQNYFRMYEKLAGMSGTAVTEAEEFHKIYKLEVVIIPTNRPLVREDAPDRIYKDEKAKFNAVVNQIVEINKTGQPVLVGTVSIEKSEMLSDMLKRKGVKHQVLNAKKHQEEAMIVAQAGKLGAVTVATNMAGRGVDIVLGGTREDRDEKEWQKEHDKVLELGGLCIIGTERHEARRIDNQLRGRAGRQGDPGFSRFYVSLDDDVISRFGGDRIQGIMNWAGFDEDTPIENKLINRSVESAQTRVEGYHFDIRKHLVEYDDVVNQQRELIYEERKKVISGADLKANILSMVDEEIKDIVAAYSGNNGYEEWNIEGLLGEIATIYAVPPDINAEALSSLSPKQVEERLIEQAHTLYDLREQEMGASVIRTLERLVMLRTIDNLWREHLTVMEEKRLEAGWQSLRQVKGIDAYKNMGYAQFEDLLVQIRSTVAHTIFRVNLVRTDGQRPKTPPVSKIAAGVIDSNKGNSGNDKKQKQKITGKKVGRNDPCPCGSGKKYKHCHGK